MKKCMGCMRDYNENYDKCPVCGYSTWNIEEDIRKKEDSLKAETILNARYIIGRVLSYTEYGITYLSWDALLQKRVVIKEYLPVNSARRKTGEEMTRVLKAQDNTFISGRNAFEKEIMQLNQNQDISSLVNVFRCIRENGTSYMVMEYLEGYTLQDYVEEYGKIPGEKAAELLSKLLSVVEELHERGIYHWNIDPDNIYLSETGEIHLIDPGYAKKRYFYLVRGDIDIYRRGYIAPELLLGRHVEFNADLYSLGAVYYFMITGRDPKDSTARHKRKDLRVGIWSADQALALLMKSNPERRPADVQAFREQYEILGKRRMEKNGQKRAKK
ncbi:serine/threonine protein kinase [Blautia obeum]|uniref:serine/threonine protein kinase n=1 Tax=Blautia obeum TaxID=40520 RepID=UPI003563C2A8